MKSSDQSKIAPVGPRRALSGRKVEFLIFLLALLFFLVDLALPLGVALGIPYIVVVLASYWSPRRNFILLTSGLCTVLAVAGYFLSPADGAAWKAILNRFLVLFAIWIVGILSFWRKGAEEKLRESEARVCSIVETAVAGIITIDTHGMVESFNPAAERLFGYRAEEILGQKVNMLMPSPHREAHDDYIRRYLESGEAKIIGIGREVEARRKNGSPVPIHLSISEMRLGGRRMFTGFVSDMTERRRAEEEIRRLNADLEERVRLRTRELELLNRELEAFTYSVSHDLRAPLRAIDGFSQALLEDYRDRLDEAGADYLKRVRAASQRMGRLIDDLLTLSRMTRVKMAREKIDLSALARTVVEELQQQEPDRRIELAIADGITGHGDPHLLRAVLENLLGNAWKFTARREQARIEFGATTAGKQKAYFVRDNGAGFEMAYSDKLFSAFQRLHTAGEFPGSGIGLATVQRIIHRHGGKVWAKGKVDEGATFYFTLGGKGRDK